VTTPPSERGYEAARRELTSRLLKHIVCDIGAVRLAMHLLGGRTIVDFDNRRLALLLSYLDQAVPPRADP
jgi:hypothetical protein